MNIEKLLRLLIASGFIVGGVSGLSACTDDDGPFEEAGEEIEDEVDDAF